MIKSLLLSFVFILPGWTWTDSLYPASNRGRHGYRITPLLALILSFVLLLTCSFLLSSINQLQPMVLLPILGLVTCLGFHQDYKKRGIKARHHFGWGLGICLLFTILFGVLRLLPYHSDWIVGGWDPGVIINQGIYIGRTGAAHPQPGFIAPLLASDHSDLFSRSMCGLREVFPGIPMDPGTGAWKFYFFPITPLVVALLYQIGEASMAVRMPLFIGILAIILFTCSTGWRRPCGFVFIPLLFLLQPIMVYHLRTPTSEITELLLLGAFWVLWSHAQPHGLRRWLGGALLYFATINRVSFELFGAWLILIVACAEAGSRDRRQAALDHASLTIGLLLGIAYYVHVSPISLAKLGHVMPAIHSGTLLMLSGVLALDLLCIRREIKGIRLDLVLLGLGLVGFFILEQRTAAHWVEFRRNVLALSNYTGWLLVGMAVPGCWFLFRRPTKSAYWAVFFFSPCWSFCVTSTRLNFILGH